jgi:DNA-directed RNA polymerase subunit H (RpoH/RPB5)
MVQQKKKKAKLEEKKPASNTKKKRQPKQRGKAKTNNTVLASNIPLSFLVPGALSSEGPFLHRFFDVVQFVLRMIDHRGWKCGVRRFMQQQDLFLEYMQLLGAGMEQDGLVPSLTIEGHTRSGRPCTVLFGAPGVSSSFNKDAAVKACQKLPEKTEALILVLPGKPTIAGLKIIKAAVPRVWIFSHLQCWADFMRNVGVPEHRRLEGDKRSAVVNRFRPSRLPRIRQSEPVAQYYGWTPGTIVQVKQCQDVGVVINYRQVDTV